MYPNGALCIEVTINDSISLLKINTADFMA